ncbi:beta-ketoacyl-ACP synthase 3 [Bacillus chungangensis]|uniref:3-oxoacyl-[acyl-carrier-protein] synthase-3 n=1 Tax=Bacillus chungangensis TaxID=587633 RepID=A0ABT9WNM7_9BACI|nr:beta-ketoacyl-ACP synthase 3 [Bacillus chungangensis]MDQ0174822.1 3-oxoacyl-[acyl-carrier-protein] synthase-3 [Bacillus chungangensis]
MFKVKISGIGKAVGSKVVESKSLEKLMDVNQGWIKKATGIYSRYYVDYENGENALTLGTEAAKKAIENSDISLEDIDCIIGANGSPMQALPCAASLYQREIGLSKSGIPCFDVDSTCYSFGNALIVAANLIDKEIYKNILIVSADAPSRTLDLTDNEVRALFGDGAAAAVVTKASENETSRIHHFKMHTYSDGADHTCVKGLGSLRYPEYPETSPKDYTFQMNGKEIFKFAVRLLPKFFEEFFAVSPIQKTDLKYIIPHQTSRHGIDIFRKYGFTDEQIASHIETHGNCISASIPMLLHDVIKEEKIKRGDSILLFGTSAGLSLGCISLTY